MSEENKIQLFTDEEVARLSQGKSISHDDMPMELNNKVAQKAHGESRRRLGNTIGIICIIAAFLVVALGFVIKNEFVTSVFLSFGLLVWIFGDIMLVSKRKYEMDWKLKESEEKRGYGPSSADANYYWAEKERKEKEAMRTPQQKYDDKKRAQHEEHIKNINSTMRKQWLNDEKWESML